MNSGHSLLQTEDIFLKTKDILLTTADNGKWGQVNWTHWVPFLATRCLYQGVGVHLTRGQPDPKADEMSCWPEVVPLLTTRCLYWGRGGGSEEASGGWGLHLKNEDGLLQTEDIFLKTQDSLLNTEDNRNELRSMRPMLVPLLASRCLFWGYIWAQVNQTQLSATLGH